MGPKIPPHHQVDTHFRHVLKITQVPRWIIYSLTVDVVM
jgi:hypothetical protein